MSSAPARNDRTTAFVDLMIVGGAAIILIEVLPIGPAKVVGGGIAIKLIFLARMLLLLALANWRLRRVGSSWSDLGLRRPRLVRGGIAVVLGLIVIAVTAGVIGALLARAGYSRANYAAFAPLRSNLAEYLYWLGPVSIGSAAFGEELIFRGFIRDALERVLAGGPWATLTAIVLQTIIFGMLHAYQGFAGVATASVVGLLLGFVWWGAKRNLWPGIVIHALLDSSAMTAIYLGMPLS